MWTDDHIEFTTEHEDNPNSLFVYSDGSKTMEEGRTLTGFGTVGYTAGEMVFERKGIIC
jgi:hypothetical protein